MMLLRSHILRYNILKQLIFFRKFDSELVVGPSGLTTNRINLNLVLRKNWPKVFPFNGGLGQRIRFCLVCRLEK